MDMFDEARAISGMINMRGMTQIEIAKMLGVSQSYVANKLRLLHFSIPVQREITAAGLTERHARALLRLKSDEVIFEAIRKISSMRLSVAASEVVIDGMAIDTMSRSIGAEDGECISQFERVVGEAVKRLVSHGIKARQSVEFFGNKRYITVTIEENH